MSYGQPPPSGGGYAAPPAASASTNVLAIISLVVGILALLPLCAFVFWFVSIFLGIVAAALGFVARNQIKAAGQSGEGIAIAGLVTGILSILLGVLEGAGCAALIGLGNSPEFQTMVMLTATALTPGP
jgi:hypothetical protein